MLVAMKSTRSGRIALAYVRVSTDMQVEEGASLAAQETLLTEEAERQGWDIEIVREEGKSGKSVDGRPALTDALDRLDRGEADILLAVRLDRVSRSVFDFASMVKRAARKGWLLKFLDQSVDTSDPNSKLLLNVRVAFAEHERDMIGLRTREGMAQRKREGARFGREVAPEFIDTYRMVMDWADEGWGYNAIAKALNDAGTPTARGGKWYASTVRAIVKSDTAARLRAEG